MGDHLLLCVGCENDVEAADFSGENGRETGGSSKQMETGGQSREVKVETDDDEGQVENLQYLLDITDESSILDCEVGKRLNQMVPVPVSMDSSCIIFHFSVRLIFF